MTETPPDEPTPAAETDDGAESSPEPPSEVGRRSRWLVAVLAAGVVVVLAAVGLVGTRILGVWGEDSVPNAEATGSPSPTEPPSPFDGTPAEDFAEGADGIVLPEAEAIGDFTANEVADALELVRDALVAARLDESMLIDHDPKPLLQLLAPDQRSTVDEAFDSGEFGRYATQVAEDRTLAPVPLRVEGRVSYATTIDGGLPVLEVVTRFVWVYPFDPTEEQAIAHLVVVRDEIVWWVRFHELWLESSRGLWVPDAVSNAWGADCDRYGNGVVRPDGEADAGPEDPAEADKIFDPEQALDPDDVC